MSATKIGPYTLSRGQMVPCDYESESAQDYEVAGDGSVMVGGSPYVERYHEIKTFLPNGEARNIRDYIENSLRFRAETVVVVDGFGVSRLCRYWAGKFKLRYEGGEHARVELVFREEVTS